MEMLDIVDENNELTGKKEERRVVHKKYLWHRHANCWIMNEKGELLFQKRAATKEKNPNKWAKTGGHVMAGESPKQGLIREIKEEIGVELKENDIELIEIFKSEDPTNKSYSYEYFTMVNYDINDYVIQKEELSEIKYYTIEELIDIKKKNDDSFTFSKWSDEEFYEKMQILKEKRKYCKKGNI